MTSQFDDTDRQVKPSRPPISAHRAFVPIVTLWFAALLGLGSLVAPVALIERMVLSSNIARFLPMVAPPLDLAGRGIVAITLALLGAAAGAVIARRLSMLLSGKAARSAAEKRAPISAHEELGDSTVEAEAEDEAPRRSRRLAIEDDQQAEQVIEFAPLPMSDIVPSDDQDDTIDADYIDLVAIAEEAPAETEDVEQEQAEEFPAEDETVLEAVAGPVPGFASFEPQAEQEHESEAPAATEEPAAEPIAVVPPEEKFVPASSPCMDRPLEELGLVQLVERLGASMERKRAMHAIDPVASPMPAALPMVEMAEPVQPTPEVFAEVEEPSSPETSATELEAPVAAAEDVTDEIAVATEEEPATDPVESVAEDDLVEEMEVTQPQAGLTNPFMQFSSFDEEDEDEELANLADSFRLPLAEKTVEEVDPTIEEAPAKVEFASEEELEFEGEDQIEDEGEEEESEGDDEVFGSLLSLRKPFPLAGFDQAPFTQEDAMEAEPVEPALRAFDLPSSNAGEEREPVSAPGTSPVEESDRMAHERALREALLSLQQMSRAS